MFTLLKCPSYKNVHPTKMFTPTATKHLITQISDCRHTPINACISSTEGEVLRTHNCSWSSTRFRFNLKVKVRESESGMNFWYYQAGSNIKWKWMNRRKVKVDEYVESESGLIHGKWKWMNRWIWKWNEFALRIHCKDRKLIHLPGNFKSRMSVLRICCKTYSKDILKGIL